MKNVFYFFLVGLMCVWSGRASSTSPEIVIHGFNEGLGPIEKDGKWGYINNLGEIVIEPQFDIAYQFKNAFGLVQLNGKTFYIDRNGVRKSPEFDGTACIPESPEGMCSFWLISGEDAKWGYLGKDFKIVIEPQFSWAGRFSDGLAPVQIGAYPNTKTGYIDQTGEFLIEPIFQFGTEFSEGLANVVANGKHFFIDTSGTKVFNYEFRSASRFREGLASVNIHFEPNYNPNNYNFVRDGKWGFINKKGEWAIPPKYEQVGFFYDGRVVVKANGEYSWIDSHGNPISDGPILDQNGQIVIDLSQPVCSLLDNELCLFRDKLSYKTGFVSKAGEIIIPPIFDSAGGFSEGIAAVKTEGKWAYINRKGEFIWKPMD